VDLDKILIINREEDSSMIMIKINIKVVVEEVSYKVITILTILINNRIDKASVLE
jgi:hypothetical protein